MREIVSVNTHWKNFDAESLPVNLSTVKEWREEDTDFASVYFSGAAAADGTARVFARLARPVSKRGQDIPAVVCYGDGGGFLSEDFRRLLLDEGVAVFEVDYGGKAAGKSRYTIYPDSLRTAEFGDGSGLFEPYEDINKICWMVWAANALRAVTALRGMPGILADKTAFFGEGYGTDAAWKLAFIDKRISAAIAVLPKNLSGKKALAAEDAAAHDQNLTAWASVVSPRAYAQHIRTPFLLAPATNDATGGFDGAYQDFLRLTESESQVISMAERLSSALKSDQADNIRLFVRRFLLGGGGKFPERPGLNVSLTKEGKIRFSFKADENFAVERAEVFYSAGGREAACRNWVSLKAVPAENGEYQADVAPGVPDRNFFAYPAVKYAGGLHICGKLAVRSPKSLGAEKGMVRSSRLVYDDTMGLDCFLCDCGTSALCKGGVKITEGPMEIPGVFAEGGELATYKIGDSFFAPDAGCALVLDVACACSCELTVRLKSEGNRPEYFVKKSITGQNVWQKLTVDRTDFKTKEGSMLQNWQEAAYLSVSADCRVLVSTILWA